MGGVRRKQLTNPLVRHSLSSSHILPQKVLELLQIRGCPSRQQTAGCCLAARRGLAGAQDLANESKTGPDASLSGLPKVLFTCKIRAHQRTSVVIWDTEPEGALRFPPTCGTLGCQFSRGHLQQIWLHRKMTAELTCRVRSRSQVHCRLSSSSNLLHRITISTLQRRHREGQ